ncbi:hypothetical protein FJZ36_10805 [Candidatus Poribacteria bacterium]|nr:hypothetical protein [Candidatus Poribacteria bacterium]
MRAGAAQTNITPLLGTSLAGYFHDRKARDVRDELHAKAIVLDDGDTTVAFVICDIIALPGETVRAARDMIEATCAIPGGNVLVAATHTHTGPSPAGLLGTPCAESYMASLPERIADSVRRAAARMQPAKWQVRLGQETRLSFNRRFRMKDGSVVMNPGYRNPEIVEPVGPIDPDVAVLHVVNAETGAGIALLANFALHYVGGSPGDWISADYFGMFAETVREWCGESFVVALANGFCGDVNNIDVNNPPTRHGGWEQAEHVARLLASNVIALIDRGDFQDAGTLSVAREELTIPVRAITDAMRRDARRVLGDRSPDDPSDGYSRDELYARELLLLDAMPRQVTTEVQAISLDGVGFVGLPGEVFAQYAVDLAARSPLRPLFKIELANDYVGYVPTRAAFDEGSYETWLARSSKLVPEAGEMMVAAAERLLSGLASDRV